MVMIITAGVAFFGDRHVAAKRRRLAAAAA
jgi:hypothetical protein